MKEYEVIAYKDKIEEVRELLQSRGLIKIDYPNLKRFFNIECDESTAEELRKEDGIHFVVDTEYYENLELGVKGQHLDMTGDN